MVEERNISKNRFFPANKTYKDCNGLKVPQLLYDQKTTALTLNSDYKYTLKIALYNGNLWYGQRTATFFN